MIQLLAILVHPNRYDMKMMTVNIFVLVNNIWLVSITQFLHILLCNFRILLIGQYIFRVGIQGNMQNRAFRFLIRDQIGFKRTHTDTYLIIAISRFYHPVGKNYFPLMLIYLGLIICQCSKNGTT